MCSSRDADEDGIRDYIELELGEVKSTTPFSITLGTDDSSTQRQRVTEMALLEHEQLDAVDAEIAKLIDDCVKDSERAAPPTQADLTTGVYVAY